MIIKIKDQRELMSAYSRHKWVFVGGNCIAIKEIEITKNAQSYFRHNHEIILFKIGLIF